MDTLVVVTAACFSTIRYLPSLGLPIAALTPGPLQIDCPLKRINVISRQSSFVLAKCAKLPTIEATAEFGVGNIPYVTTLCVWEYLGFNSVRSDEEGSWRSLIAIRLVAILWCARSSSFSMGVLIGNVLGFAQYSTCLRT